MKELNIPFSLFDFFAVLLPGVVGILGLYLLINPSLTAAEHDAVFSKLILQRFTGELTFFTALVLISYLLGQIYNALSEVLIDRLANRMFDAHMVHGWKHYNVQQAIQQKFGDDILQQSVRRTFMMIEATVSAVMPDAAATARRFIALAVMFQSLCPATLFIGITLIRGYVIGEIFVDAIVDLLLTEFFVLLLALLLFWSYRRYKRMWSDTMYMSFVAYVSLGDKGKVGRSTGEVSVPTIKEPQADNSGDQP